MPLASRPDAVQQDQGPFHLGILDFDRDGRMDILVYIAGDVECLRLKLAEGAEFNFTDKGCTTDAPRSHAPGIVLYDSDKDGYKELFDPHFGGGHPLLGAYPNTDGRIRIFEPTMDFVSTPSDYGNHVMAPRGSIRGTINPQDNIRPIPHTVDADGNGDYEFLVCNQDQKAQLYATDFNPPAK